MSKINNYELNTKILTKISPFSQSKFSKKSKVKGFIGRQKELSELISSIKIVAYSRQNTAIKISGPGGSGKSTLFGYLCQIIENKEIFTNPDYQIKPEEFKIFPAFIDAPKGHETDFRYFWTSIVDSLRDSFGENSGEFFEYFGVRIILKCLQVLFTQKIEQPIIEIMEKLIPDFQNQIQKFSWNQIVKPKFIQDNYSLASNEIITEVQKIIRKNARKLMKSYIIFPNGEKCRFKYEEKYMKVIFQIFDEDIDKSQQAIDKLKGLDTIFLKSDKEIFKLLEWINNILEWINELPICFIVGVDNLGYLTVDLPKSKSPYPSFIQTLLQMRDELSNFLFVFLGINDDWDELELFLKDKNYKDQLIGFISHETNLSRLSKVEAVDALRYRMQEFWTSCKLSPEKIYYPFSSKFFEYLYDFRLKDFRQILNDLNDIWNNFHKMKKVRTLDDSFDMIRFIRCEWVDSAYLESFSLNKLLPFEKSVLRNKWISMISNFASQERSLKVEKELSRFLNVLREHERPRQISIVQNPGTIQIQKEGKLQTRYPDVYVQIINTGTIDDKRSFEIQVKIYSEKTFVKLDEIEGSLDCLYHRKIDALIFLITGLGLDKRAIDHIRRLGLSERVFYPDPLNKNQIDALLFMVFYFEIMRENPSLEIVKLTLKEIFNQPWDKIVERIKTISSFQVEPSIMPSPIHTHGVKSTLDEFTKVPIESKLVSTKTNREIATNKDILKFETTKPNRIKKSLQKVSDVEIQDLKDQPEKDEPNLEIIISRYTPVKHETFLILQLAMNRNDRYKGRITKDYVKKRIPPELHEEQCRIVFDQLRKDSKKEWPKVAEYKGTSLIITELGKEYYKLLKS